ncbi:uncharacterized protein K460DRAFT_180733 [Cucurbitaria berberidis CBS 394.84]|uniref:Uncharacterized protein n=1 Tax=Cucurbitaria berberidis CBS 394.84 TaxID=1168544 RepID=A0A9P4L5D2_9PLEO|nr:uncharacterized protein K460DRAFT_180733 [Cucurbitaria berberidis CBS 394.84]KAF1842227.1 hypothetical protein K460DRAFT_180733 [Cucurbitaria berberidis CBS 394.84]
MTGTPDDMETELFSPASPKSDTSMSSAEVRRLVFERDELAAQLAPETWLENRLTEYIGDCRTIRFLTEEMERVKKERGSWEDFTRQVRKVFDEYNNDAVIKSWLDGRVDPDVPSVEIVARVQEFLKELDECRSQYLRGREAVHNDRSKW